MTTIVIISLKMVVMLTDSVCVCVVLSEELRSVTTQDACMCEAQIMFQEKVQSAFQELNRKHILWKTYINVVLLCS